MKKVYFVPKDKSLADCKDQWEGKFQEIHHGVSENNKHYIKFEDKEHSFEIPEYQHLLVPDTCANTDFTKFLLHDDFAEFEENPVFKLEIWSKDYDNPQKDHKLVSKHPLSYTHQKSRWGTDHIRLDPGWYVLKFFKDDKLCADSELSVFELVGEEE